jgi:hypothetical protein
MDLARSKQYTFYSFQKQFGHFFFFLVTSVQTGAKVYEYVLVRQCHCADVIEQTFAVILHRQATAASCRLYFLGLIKEK